ncbi:MAG: DUF3179 domain-containing (seleno)protein [Woeseiaceae bacterium]|nr:DUF3179 domain-containing (seleno)protein [Woeseiaceae bacterium]
MTLDKNLAPKIAFWAFMLTGLGLAFFLFKDLADISQWVIQSARETTMTVWYQRVPITIASFIAIVAASVIWIRTRAGAGTKGFVALLIIYVGFVFSGMINPYIMMRPRQDDGVFVSVAEATRYVRPDESVIVYEIDGLARAHPDVQVLRPHVASAEPVNDQDVVMTYCGLTNLGMAYVPEIDGERLELAPMTQLENNLVLVDMKSGEPIQQLWGQREIDVVEGNDSRMQQYPTFRMPFERFAAAYPNGQVFINDYLVKDMRKGFLENPALYVYDRTMEFIFNTAIDFQQNHEAPVFPTIDHYDERLPNKELIWGFDIQGDYVAYTEQFVRANGNVVNAVVGGEPVVIAYDAEYESLGVYYNLTGEEIRNIDFFGVVGSGAVLPRVETVKAGAFWVVWANFFPDTDLNRA